MNTAKKFKNFSTEDFTWNFDGNPRSFLAGQEVYMMESEAEHFAKHLIDRELNKAGLPTNSEIDRNRMLDLCFPGDEVISTDEALQKNEEAKNVVKKGAKSKKEVEKEEINPVFDEE